MAFKDFPVDHHARPRRYSRRELASALLSGVATGFVTPLFPASHPVSLLLLDGEAIDAAETLLSPEPAKSSFLSGFQLAALAVLSEAVVPGSRKALAPEFIDLLLSVDTGKNQQEFVRSLAALDGASRRRNGKGIAAADEAQLRGLLADVSSPGSPVEGEFLNLRHWIAGAYYSSEAGMRELGWTPDRVFPVYPSCTHSEDHS